MVLGYPLIPISLFASTPTCQSYLIFPLVCGYLYFRFSTPWNRLQYSKSQEQTTRTGIANTATVTFLHLEQWQPSESTMTTNQWYIPLMLSEPCYHKLRRVC